MLRDLLVLRANYVFGRWKVVQVDDTSTDSDVRNEHVTSKSSAVKDSKPRRRTANGSQK